MEKMRQIPLGEIDPDVEIPEEAVQAAAEEKVVQSEQDLIDEAMKQEGFISYEERKKQIKDGPGRKKWLALIEKLREKDKKIS